MPAIMAGDRPEGSEWRGLFAKCGALCGPLWSRPLYGRRLSVRPPFCFPRYGGFGGKSRFLKRRNDLRAAGRH
jgi:hypothetical protein